MAKGGKQILSNRRQCRNMHGRWNVIVARLSPIEWSLDQFVCCRALYPTIPAPGWRSPRWHSCWLDCQRPSENIEDKLSGNSSRGICGIVLPIVQAFYSNKIKRRLDDYRKTFRGE